MNGRAVLLFFFTAAASACAGAKPETVTPTAATASARPRPVDALPFIHDDYPRALAEAKSKNKPLFVDAWAPWCHSCMSLRTYVLTDVQLKPLASDFVWLSVDTEKDSNAEWVTRHPHSALPTLWVIDPVTDRAILKWAGTVTADELRGLLTIAMADADGSGSGKGDGKPTEATAAFVRGNRAVAAGDADAAEREFVAALEAAPKAHAQRARMAEALVGQLAQQKKEAACAEVAAREAPALPQGTSRASTIVAGLGCARDAKRDADGDFLVTLALHDVGDRGSPLLPDDRSALYEEILATKSDRGDKAGAKALAAEWAGFLDAETKAAKTAEARASLDPWVLAAAMALGDPARAVPALERSERDFPSDYNPPARLGRAFLELGRLEEADKAADRAIARVYGPRAMRVYELKADIARARKDTASEAAALETALSRSEHSVLTVGQRSVRDRLAKRLAKIR